MANRFISRTIVVNKNEQYKEYLQERGIKQIVHYDTPIFSYPTDKELNSIPYTEYTWKYGDRLAKIASEYLGNPKDWWIIARFNKIATESDIKIGQNLKIPTDLTELRFLIRG